MSKYNIQEYDLETGKQIRLTGYSNAAFEDPIRSYSNNPDQTVNLEKKPDSIHVCNKDDKAASNNSESTTFNF